MHHTHTNKRAPPAGGARSCLALESGTFLRLEAHWLSVCLMLVHLPVSTLRDACLFRL
jgi:hypothetical protein